MNLFDLLGGTQAARFNHTGPRPMPHGNAPGGFAMPAAPVMNNPGVGTQAALAQYGPQISQQLQAALARMRAAQMQQTQATANTVGQQQGGAAQQSIDDQTAALIAQRMQLGAPDPWGA